MDSITPLSVGQVVPDFALFDLRGVLHTLYQYRGRISIVYFWSAECPWVERCDAQMAVLQKTWGETVVFLPVASNAHETEAEQHQAALDRSLPVVLRDPDQVLARLFAAQATPQCFLIDAEGILRYRGAVDDVTYRKKNAEHFYLSEAVKAVLAGLRPEIEETPAYGCAIVSL